MPTTSVKPSLGGTSLGSGATTTSHPSQTSSPSSVPVGGTGQPPPHHQKGIGTPPSGSPPSVTSGQTGVGFTVNYTAPIGSSGFAFILAINSVFGQAAATAVAAKALSGAQPTPDNKSIWLSECSTDASGNGAVVFDLSFAVDSSMLAYDFGIVLNSGYAVYYKNLLSPQGMDNLDGATVTIIGVNFRSSHQVPAPGIVQWIHDAIWKLLGEVV